MVKFDKIANIVIDAPPSSLMDSTMSLKVKTAEGEGVGARFLACNTSTVERSVCWSSKIRLRRLTSNSIIHTDLHKTKQQVG
jgi:hypothetical protein